MFFRASLADFKRPSAELFAVQAFDGGAAFRFIAHRHERETPGLACFSIGYDLNLCDASKLFEDMVKVGFSDGQRNISNVELHCVTPRSTIAPIKARKPALQRRPTTRISDRFKAF